VCEIGYTAVQYVSERKHV